MAGFCKDCNYWRKSTYEPNNDQIGVCGIDGKEKEDMRHGYIVFEKETHDGADVEFG